MSRSPELLHHVTELLEPYGPPVEVKRMFSGWSLQRDGIPFALVLDELYLRVDDETRPAYIAAGCEPFRYANSKREVSVERYYGVPDGALDDGERLADLVDEAVEAALRDPTKRRGGR
ncbi:TfoX/Sxy family protein [Svornostia abyssi]|uniref:TfoX/Sxy family protein n=1 Tax=Svornostia abyssi TaxID=2898438 RepID=A0ABY5PGD3_9ACTN|nr:TfoX/Sxy family protein [Parviterribacteraceae bacterium J379]